MNDCGLEMIYGALQHDLTNVDFKKALHIKPLKSVDNLMTRAERYIKAEEKMILVKEPSQTESTPSRQREEIFSRSEKKSRQDRSPPKADRHSSRNNRKTLRFGDFTKLNSSRIEVMLYAKNASHLCVSFSTRKPFKRQDSKKYCRHHNDNGHDMEDCYQLKNDIEELINKGHFRKYVGDKKAPRNDDDEERRSDRNPDRPTLSIRIVAVISGEPAAGGSSSSQRKKYV